MALRHQPQHLYHPCGARSIQITHL